MMTNHEVETKLRNAVSNAAPDVLDSVLADCEQQKGTVIYMAEKKQNPWVRRVAGLAAALVLVVGGAFGYRTYQQNHTVAATVSLDVNPSIEITVNRDERVLAVTPLNNDGVTVIGDMDFTGSDIDVAVNALIGSMLRNGYLNDIANSILVSVDNADPAAAAVLQERLAAEISGLLQTDTFSGAVLSQTVTHGDTELLELANTYDITAGKAELIRQLTAQNTLYTFEELAALSINELNLLSASGNIQLDSVSSVGTASDKGYIGREAALSAALSHAGITQTAVSGHHEAELDYEHGTMVYELEFYADGREYEYDIDAVTGEVVWSSSEREFGTQHDHHNDHHDFDDLYDDLDDLFDDDRNNDTPVSGSQPAAGQPTTYIGEDAALAAALTHAGVSADAASGKRVELDEDDGRMVYEIEFRSGAYEYEYEVDAVSGAIVKSDKEFDD